MCFEHHARPLVTGGLFTESDTAWSDSGPVIHLSVWGWSRKRCCVSWFLVVHLSDAADSFLSLEIMLLKSWAVFKEVQTRRKSLVSYWITPAEFYAVSRPDPKLLQLSIVPHDFGFLFQQWDSLALGMTCFFFFLFMSPLSFAQHCRGRYFWKHSSVTYLYDQLELWTRRGKSKGDDRKSKASLNSLKIPGIQMGLLQWSELIYACAGAKNF